MTAAASKSSELPDDQTEWVKIMFTPGHGSTLTEKGEDK